MEGGWMKVSRTRQRIRYQAIRWVMRLPTATGDQNAQFWKWLTTSREHVCEFFQAVHADYCLGDSCRASMKPRSGT